MTSRAPPLTQSLQELIKRHFEERGKPPFVPGQTSIPLMVPPFDADEVWEAVESLLSTQVTMGEKVRQFEAMFADYIGVKHAVMVNSGSSANLLALSILTNPRCPGRLQRGDEVITPAVTWATTVFPILNVGLTPVLADVGLDTFNIDPQEIEKAITPKTRAIMVVHLLGNPCRMEKITAIARRHDLLVIEDCCEAHGAEFHSQRVGSFGDLSTFSFFFGHHISTIEGGMLLTSNEEYAEFARALRAHGWIRDLTDREDIARRHSDMDPRYLFLNTGYNFRPTEIQGGFGIHQLGKLERYIEARRENARYWDSQLQPCSPNLLHHREAEGTRHVWFGYPLLVRPEATFRRAELVAHLEAMGVETRPIMAGNIEEQPAMRLFSYRKVGELANARLIHRNAFYIGIHQGLGPAEREAVVAYIRKFMNGLEPAALGKVGR